MKLLFNDLAKFRECSGVGGYVQELSSHLKNAKFLSETFWGKPLSRAMSQTLGTRKKHPLASFIKKIGHDSLTGYLRAVSKFLIQDLYHEPDLIPLLQTNRTIVTAHDLSVLRFPHWHPKHRVSHYEKRIASACPNIVRFMADSEQTKKDLIQLLNIPPEKIDVVHLAPRESIVRQLDFTPAKPSDRYFLYAGTIEPRKNIDGLLMAYQMLREETRRRYPLYLVGGRGWNSESIFDQIEKCAPIGVRYLGYLPDNELAEYLRSASAFVYPSHFEGFGLPPLEAMAAGAPVISSHSGSLAEIVGNAAEIVDPQNPQSISEAMERVVSDENLAKTLIQRGTNWVKQYDWKKTAEQTVASYEKAFS